MCFCVGGDGASEPICCQFKEHERSVITRSVMKMFCVLSSQTETFPDSIGSSELCQDINSDIEQAHSDP